MVQNSWSIPKTQTKYWKTWPLCGKTIIWFYRKLSTYNIPHIQKCWNNRWNPNNC